MKNKFLTFLETLALGVGGTARENAAFDITESWEVLDPYVSSVFKNIEILTGKFLVPSYQTLNVVNDLNYRIKEDLGENERVFTLFAKITSFEQSDDIKASSYEYYLFFPDDEIVQAVENLEKVFDRNLRYVFFFLLWAIVQLSISSLLIRFISRQMVDPINTLTKRIKYSVKGIRNLRQAHQFQ